MYVKQIFVVLVLEKSALLNIVSSDCIDMPLLPPMTLVCVVLTSGTNTMIQSKTSAPSLTQHYSMIIIFIVHFG